MHIPPFFLFRRCSFSHAPIKTAIRSKSVLLAIEFKNEISNCFLPNLKKKNASQLAGWGRPARISFEHFPLLLHFRRLFKFQPPSALLSHTQHIELIHTLRSRTGHEKKNPPHHTAFPSAQKIHFSTENNTQRIQTSPNSASSLSTRTENTKNSRKRPLLAGENGVENKPQFFLCENRRSFSVSLTAESC